MTLWIASSSSRAWTRRARAAPARSRASLRALLSRIGDFLWRIGYRSPPGRSATDRTFPRQPGRGRASGMHRQSTPALLPADVGQRARARWLEEYADTRMGEVFIWRLFNQVTINPFLWGEPTDQQIL